MKRIFPKVLVFLFLLLVHISIIPNLPYPMNLLHVPFAVVIFLLIVYDQKTGILWALCFGVFLDFFSFEGFGIKTLSIMLTILLIHTFFTIFFTNKSFYTLLLLATLWIFSYNAVFLALTTASYFLGISSYEIVLTKQVFINILWQGMLIIPLEFLFWHGVNMMSKRLKIVFLKQ